MLPLHQLGAVEKIGIFGNPELAGIISGNLKLYGPRLTDPEMQWSRVEEIFWCSSVIVRVTRLLRTLYFSFKVVITWRYTILLGARAAVKPSHTPLSNPGHVHELRTLFLLFCSSLGTLQ